MKNLPLRKSLFGFIAVTITLLISGISAEAQVSLTGDNDPYTQNFNSYVGTAASIPQGWGVAFTGTPVFNGVGTGSSATGGAWAYATVSGENSFGALRSATPGSIVLSVSFTNNTGGTITDLVIALNYEQYRYANTSGFSVSGTGAISGQNLSTLNYTGSAVGVNGTPTTTAATLTLTGLNITNGSTFGIAWITTDDTGSDNGIAIDNFSLTYTPAPEPTTFAAGAFAFCSIFLHKRRRLRGILLRLR